MPPSPVTSGTRRRPQGRPRSSPPELPSHEPSPRLVARSYPAPRPRRPRPCRSPAHLDPDLGWDRARPTAARTGRRFGRTDDVTTSPDVSDEVLGLLRAVCLALPEAVEQTAWVGVRWRVGTRTFADVLVIDDGWPPAYARAAATAGPVTVLMFRSAPPELDVLRAAGPPFFSPPWRADEVGMVLDGGVDRDEVAELVTESYCAQAPLRLRDLIEPARRRRRGRGGIRTPDIFLVREALCQLSYAPAGTTLCHHRSCAESLRGWVEEPYDTRVSGRGGTTRPNRRRADGQNSEPGVRKRSGGFSASVSEQATALLYGKVGQCLHRLRTCVRL